MTIFGSTAGKMVYLGQRNKDALAVLLTPQGASQEFASMTTSQSTPMLAIPQLTPTELARFWSKVDRSGGPDSCWLWMPPPRSDGYGRIKFGRRIYAAHRIAYTLCVGPIPEGLQLDHVKDRGCTTRKCCNPAHLEPVTNRENSLRSESITAENARKTRCVMGHPFTPENTRWGHFGKKTKRACRACDAKRQREYQARQIAKRGT